MANPTGVFCSGCIKWVKLIDHEKGYHFSLMYESDCEHKILVTTQTAFDGGPIKERTIKED